MLKHKTLAKYMMIRILVAIDSNLKSVTVIPLTPEQGVSDFFPFVFLLKVGQEKSHPGGRGDTKQQKWHIPL